MVLGIDFRRVFRHWAQSAEVDESLFYDRWTLDQAYKAQEIGQLNFAAYASHLSSSLGVNMPLQHWRAGWNALWTEPYDEVVAHFASLKQRYTLCAFSNTNAEHAASFMQRYPDIMAQFDQIFLSHEIGCRKPSAAAFHHVCQLMQAEPGQVTFLDDNQENVEGARSAGLTAQLTRTETDVVAVLQAL